MGASQYLQSARAPFLGLCRTPTAAVAYCGGAWDIVISIHRIHSSINHQRRKPTRALASSSHHRHHRIGVPSVFLPPSRPSCGVARRQKEGVPPPPIAVASSATQATGRCHWSLALCSLLAAWARRLLAVESGEGWPALDGWAAWGRNDSTDTVRSIDKPASQASRLARPSSATSNASPFDNPDTSISSVCGTAMERPMRP